MNLVRFRSAQEVLELPILAEDVSQRLIHDLVGGSAKEGRVLIELRGSGCIEPDCGADPANLIDLEQRHFLFPFGLK